MSDSGSSVIKGHGSISVSWRQWDEAEFRYVDCHWTAPQLEDSDDGADMAAYCDAPPLRILRYVKAR